MKTIYERQRTAALRRMFISHHSETIQAYIALITCVIMFVMVV